MSYINVYPARIDWENEPSINTPINALNLNKMDYALYNIDQTLANWDTTKANQSDLLLCVKSITYDTDTGVFVFTWQNGTTQTVDLNIEKIPVSFSMDANGVITMTTEDGTQYTADVGTLIKTYTFTDSSVIDFTVTTDESGNKTVTADIVDGSITGNKLQPNYLADCQTAATNAGNSANSASGSASDSEAWAVGTRGGVPVPSTDPAYENNSYYWSQHGANSLVGLTDTDINNPQNNQTLKYDATSQKWINGTGGGGAGSLDDLSDVTLTAPQAEGDVLVRDSNGIYKNNPKSLYPKSVELTKAEYDALEQGGTLDPTTEYFITDIDVSEAYYVITSAQTALTGATSLTFTNSYITPTSDIRILAEPASCKTTGSTQYKVKAKVSSISSGSATISFPALAENTEFWLLINNPLAIAQMEVPLSSYIGMVIQSTTLDTEEKVKAQYGGLTWIQHSGYMLRGATSGVVANSAVKTGGEDSVTLTANQMPQHTHAIGYSASSSSSVYALQSGLGVPNTSANGLYTSQAGGGQAHNNIPNYKSVYIWERTA